MRSITVASLCAALCGALAVAAAAEEQRVLLKKAPGLEKVETNCAICHTLDYIPMNSPFLNAAGWDAEVAKMINAYGAPIEPSDAKIISDYLKSTYGTDARG